MKALHTRLRAFLARLLDMLDAGDWHDAVLYEEFEAAGRFQHTGDLVWRLRLNGITAEGASEDEVIANWIHLARRYVARFLLELIASGRLVFHFDQSWDIVVDRFDGETRLGPEKLRLAAWPVYKAGLLDRFGSITAAGRELLATAPASAERAP